jgi:hypothetical protein
MSDKSEVIRLRAVGGRDWESEAIEILSAGHLSHMDAQCDDGTLWGARSDAIGGKPPGVQLRPPNYEPVALEVILAIPVTLEQKQGWYAWWESQEGHKYDALDILSYVFNSETMHVEGDWICSAACLRAGQSIDIIEWDLYLPYYKFTPVATTCQYSGIKGVTWTSRKPTIAPPSLSPT